MTTHAPANQMPTPVNPRRGLLAKVGVPLLERLATPHSPDRYLEMVNPTWSLREVRATVTEVRRSATGSITVLVRPNSNWRGFRAGQHVVFTLLLAGVRRSRCYSVTSSEHHSDGLLEFTVRRGSSDVDKPGLVSGFLHDELAPGTVVHITQAQGDFVLPLPRPEQVLLISGGSGITPVMAMLRTLCDEKYAGTVTFLHYSRRAEEVPYARELAALAAEHGNVQLLLVTTQEDGPLQGHFSQEQLEQHVPGWRKATSYVCGSARLVEEIRALWTELGIDDRCWPSSSTRPPRSCPTTPRSPGRSPSPAAARPGRTPDVRCSNRPRPSDSSRSTAAGWASASPAPGAKPQATCNTCTPAK